MTQFVKFLSKIWVVSLFITLPINAASLNTIAIETESPYLVLQQAASQLFERIKALSAEQKQQPQMLSAIVEQELMPYVDYQYSSYKVLGKYVRTASKTQRQAFVSAMREYLVDTYANALMQYRDQKVIFEQDKDVSGKKMIAVHAQLQQANGQVISIDFKMRKNSKTLVWKAYDMVVEGISLLSAKQAEIASQIRKLGLDKTILQLQNRA